MWHDVKNIFHFLIIFQCLFFSFYLLSQKNNRRLGNMILAAFLLAKVVTECGGVLFHFLELRNFLIDGFPYLFYYPYPFHFAYVPLLFLYALSMTEKDFSFKKTYWLHFIPFVLFCIYFITQYPPQNADLIREKLQTGARFTPGENLFLGLAEYVQFIFYAAASLVVLKKYRQNIKDIFSSIENINMSWLNFVIFGFVGWKSLRFIELALWYATGNSNVMFLYIVAEIVFLAFVCIMIMKGIKQPVIFSGYEENLFRKKYEKTLLSDEAKSEYLGRLSTYMERQKPHLDPSVSLNDLAERVAIPPHHLSQIINSCLNQNFYDFINSYRIKESQELLSQEPADQKTVLEILYETGFNSKSAFNLAFKKFTGMTPTQFRKAQNS